MAVAFSGGRDSLALLHVVARAAAGLGLEVLALHVHHGLQPEADAWLQAAQALCRRWRRSGLPVRLAWHRVAGAPAPGDSIEAWARRERHATLAAMARAHGATLLLLAQHRRDQAETFLLQALRAGGPRGLAAMPRHSLRENLVWARPWLAQPREAIEAYVHRHRLRPIEDPSNQDTRLARNRLRLQVWPALQAAFADAEQALAGAAQHANDAHSALTELAAIDLAGAVQGGALATAALQGLSPARQRNALRTWLNAALRRGAPEALVQRLAAEALARRSGRWPMDGRVSVRLHRGLLRVCGWDEAEREGDADLASAPHRQGQARRLDLSQPGRIALPDWGGSLHGLAVDEGGAPAGLLRQVDLCARSGGERFALAPRGLPRSLKKQFQAAGIEAVRRLGPLLWVADRLLLVPGLGMDARWLAEPGRPRLQWHWRPGLDDHAAS